MDAIDRAAHVLMPLLFDGTDLRGETPTVHSGDCTKECHSCLLCLLNEARTAARAAIVAYLRFREAETDWKEQGDCRTWLRVAADDIEATATAPEEKRDGA